MVLQRVEQAQWLSNSYLAVDQIGGAGVLVDGNGVMEPLLERAEREGTEIEQILLTHAHHDHVAGVEEVRERLGAKIYAHPGAAKELGFDVDGTVEGGDRFQVGELGVEVIDTPGHAPGHVAFLFDGTDCVTGDSLFDGTVAGTVAPGAAGLEALRESIMHRLLTLPPKTRIHPGHTTPSTVERELAENPFVRVWSGSDEPGSEPCRVAGQRDATLLVWGPDYDGTNKAWVRFDDGAEVIVGGSQIERG